LLSLEVAVEVLMRAVEAALVDYALLLGFLLLRVLQLL
jgi:hypothetical protein